jgi:hypothetical protein
METLFLPLATSPLLILYGRRLINNPDLKNVLLLEEMLEPDDEDITVKILDTTVPNKVNAVHGNMEPD